MAALLVTALSVVGCQLPVPEIKASRLDDNHAFVAEGLELEERLLVSDDGWHSAPRMVSDTPFNRVGFRYDATPGIVLQVRSAHEGSWTVWQDAVVFFAEDIAHVAFVDVHEKSTEVEFRFNGEKNELTFVAMELMFLDGSALSPARGYGQQTETAVIDRAAWGARTSQCQLTTLPTSITMHHASTPNNDSVDPGVRLRQLQAFHMDVRNQCDIGYHFVIAHDGRVFAGRNLSLAGGLGLDDTIDIAFLGEFDSALPRSVAIDAGLSLIDELSTRYGIQKESAVLLHNEYAANPCPGSGMLPHMQALRNGSL